MALNHTCKSLKQQFESFKANYDALLSSARQGAEGTALVNEQHIAPLEQRVNAVEKKIHESESYLSKANEQVFQLSMERKKCTSLFVSCFGQVRGLGHVTEVIVDKVVYEAASHGEVQTEVVKRLCVLMVVDAEADMASLRRLATKPLHEALSTGLVSQVYTI